MNEIRRFWMRAIVPALALATALSAAGCGQGDRFVDPQARGLTSGPVAPERAGEAPIVDVPRLSVAPGSEDLVDRVVQTQAGLSRTLFDIDRNVIGTAASIVDGKPVLLALTSKPTTIPGRLEGIDVAQLVVGEVRAQAVYCGTSAGRADECAAGTLGAIVTDGVRNYWLSNWHVFVDQQGRTGDNICAPGRYDAGCGITPNVGTLSRFAPIRFDGGNNTVDCAIARIIPGTSVSAIEAAGSRSFLPGSQVATAAVGMAVKKVGRTTGFTTGTVVGINATINVNYGFGVARFVSAVLTSPMSQPGDSGSLICSASTNQPVALLFAGSSTITVGCPIGAVFQAIGAHIAQ